MKLIEMYSNN